MTCSVVCVAPDFVLSPLRLHYNRFVLGAAMLVAIAPGAVLLTVVGALAGEIVVVTAAASRLVRQF